MTLRSVAIACALVWLGHDVSAATYLYSFTGGCVGTCSTGRQVSGQLVLTDTSYAPGAGVEEADFVSVEFRYGDGQNLTRANPNFTGATWGDAPGQLRAFDFDASEATAPATGLTMSSTWLYSALTGGLIGSALADLDGNCPGEQDCGNPLMPDAGVYAGSASYVAQPGAEVPLPLPLLSVLGGIAALLGLRGARRLSPPPRVRVRRRRAAPAR
jgi:hypothetical protein